MKSLFYLILIPAFFISCSVGVNKTSATNNKFDSIALPADSSVFYFKIKGIWHDSVPDAVDSFRNQWYSKMLFALKEPLLHNYKGEKEVVRFTWLRTFHHPVAIRIEKQNEIIKLFTKVCIGAGGYEPGNLIFDRSISLTSNEYKLINDRLDKMNYWTMPTEERNNFGMDGAEWLFEVVKYNRYHFVRRWTPEKMDKEAVRDFGELLISLSRLPKKELRHIY